MTLVLSAGPQKQTAAQKLSAGLGRGLEQGKQMFDQYQQTQQMQAGKEQMNQFGQQYGIPNLGSLPPEIQKEFISKTMQSQNDIKKMQGKENFLNDLFSGKSQRGALDSQGQIQQASQQGFDPTTLTDEDIAKASSVDPNIGRALTHAKDVALREKRAEREFTERQREKTPEVLREKQLTSAQANADVKFNQELQSAHKQHEIKTQTLNRLEQLNKKGVTGKPYEKLLEKFGLVTLTSEGRREFAAEVKNLITDIRSILGGQFSQFEFQTILNAYPSADFSPKANEAIMKNLKDFQEIRNQEFKIAKNLKDENNGKIPEDFQSKVNDRLQEFAQSKLGNIKQNAQDIMREQLGVPVGHTILLDPNGEPLSVPNEDVDRLIELGAQMP